MVAFVAARQLCGADVKELKERRQRAATAFSDGLLLLDSKTTIRKDGATVMTRSLPYTAEEMEAFLAQKP